MRHSINDQRSIQPAYKLEESAALSVCAAFLLSLAAIGSAEADDKAPLADGVQENFEHVSCNDAPHEIRVVVSGVKTDVGVISADLYPNDNEKFLKGPHRLERVRFAAKSPTTVFCIKAPAQGDYAVSIYHDRDADGVFDKSALGLPAEPWGLSKNPKVRFGPPDIEDTLFHVNENGAAIHISLN